jgi:chromosome partitioning protein
MVVIIPLNLYMIKNIKIYMFLYFIEYNNDFTLGGKIMTIISILNQKGGSGKTTITTNLAYALSKDNYKVLIVDSDPQGSARDWNNETEGSVIPVVGLDRPSLENDIKAITGNYDYILIDGAPQLSKQMASAIKVSDVILIPVQPSPYDIWATDNLVNAIIQRKELGANLKAFFLISRAIKNTKLSTEIRNALSEYELPVLKSMTTQRVAYSNSASNGETVFQSEDKKACVEIENIKNELLGDINA